MKQYLSIYIPELKDTFKALYKKQTIPNPGDIIKVNNIFYGDTIYYAEVIKVEEGAYEMKVRDFHCV